MFFKGNPAGQHRQSREETTAGQYVIQFLTSDLCSCPDVKTYTAGVGVSEAPLLVTQEQILDQRGGVRMAKDKRKMQHKPDEGNTFRSNKEM